MIWIKETGVLQLKTYLSNIATDPTCWLPISLSDGCIISILIPYSEHPDTLHFCSKMLASSHIYNIPNYVNFDIHFSPHMSYSFQHPWTSFSVYHITCLHITIKCLHHSMPLTCPPWHHHLLPRIYTHVILNITVCSCFSQDGWMDKFKIFISYWTPTE